MLQSLGIEVVRIQFPEGIKDANELLVKYGREKATTWFRQEMERLGQGKEEEKREEPKPVYPGETQVKVRGEDVEIGIEDRIYRIRGLGKNLSYDVMKVNLRLSCRDQYYIDTLDLYDARNRVSFVKMASEELLLKAEVVQKDLGKVLLKLEEIQDQKITAALKPKQIEVPTMSEKEREEAVVEFRRLYDNRYRSSFKCPERYFYFSAFGKCMVTAYGN